MSNYRLYFNELNIQGFDLTNGFKCSDVHKFNELNKLSVTIFELNFYQDQNKWNHKFLPIEVSKNNSDTIIELAIYKNHYVLIKTIGCIFRGSLQKIYM